MDVPFGRIPVNSELKDEIDGGGMWLFPLMRSGCESVGIEEVMWAGFEGEVWKRINWGLPR
jgi:hypothetical protein